MKVKILENNLAKAAKQLQLKRFIFQQTNDLTKRSDVPAWLRRIQSVLWLQPEMQLNNVKEVCFFATTDFTLLLINSHCVCGTLMYERDGKDTPKSSTKCILYRLHLHLFYIGWLSFKSTIRHCVVSLWVWFTERRCSMVNLCWITKRNKWKSRLQWWNCEWSLLSEKQSLSDKVHNNNNNKFKNACNEVYCANIFSMLPRPGCLRVRYLISRVISCLRRPTGLLLSVIMKCCMWQGCIKWE